MLYFLFELLEPQLHGIDLGLLIDQDFPVVLGFVAGCATGALLNIRLGPSALTMPLLLAILAIPLGELGATCLSKLPFGKFSKPSQERRHLQSTNDRSRLLYA